jgi:hypothetical protein
MIPVKSRFSEKCGRKKLELTASKESIILKAQEIQSECFGAGESNVRSTVENTKNRPTQFIDSGTHIMYTY